MRKFLLLLLVAVAVSTVASAQTVKFGRINSQAIVELMPEADSAQVKIKLRAEQLQEQIDFMQAELKKKYAAFDKEATTLQGVIAEQRKKDIIDLQNRLEQFTQEADQELNQVRGLILQPIFKKLQDAIDKVSKVNLITFVIDEASQAPAFIYIDESAVKDLTPLVKAELKLKDKKPAVPAK